MPGTFQAARSGSGWCLKTVPGTFHAGTFYFAEHRAARSVLPSIVRNALVRAVNALSFGVQSRYGTSHPLSPATSRSCRGDSSLFPKPTASARIPRPVRSLHRLSGAGDAWTTGFAACRCRDVEPLPSAGVTGRRRRAGSSHVSPQHEPVEGDRRLQGWRGSLFEGRYHAIPVSDEPEAQVDRLRYLLAHGVKEGLVDSPIDWPGVHSAAALLGDRNLEGSWVDRTALSRARRRKADARDSEFEQRRVIHLEPMPCWAGHSVQERQSAIAGLVREIERRARRSRRMARGVRQAPSETSVARLCPAPVLDLATVPGLSVKAGERAEPAQPQQTARLPMRRFHAHRMDVRRRLDERLRSLVIAYRQASESLRSGDGSVPFPPACFPPSAGFDRGVPRPP